MKTVVIPTDFSENARNAMTYAAQLNSEIPCKYLLTHTYYVAPPSVDPTYVGYVNSEKERAEQLLQEELYRFEALMHHADTTIETICEYGDPANAVSRVVNKCQASLVIMGTKGASGIKEVLMGSNTVGVIKRVECPVICVPDQARFKKPERIVFAADYNGIANNHALDPMRELAEEFNSKLLVLKVRREQDDTLTVDEAEEGLALHGYLQDIDHDFYDKGTDRIEDGIEEFAREMNAEMIVMLKREHPFWEKLFSRSITNKMAFHSEIPLMVLHAIPE